MASYSTAMYEFMEYNFGIMNGIYLLHDFLYFTTSPTVQLWFAFSDTFVDVKCEFTEFIKNWANNVFLFHLKCSFW